MRFKKKILPLIFAFGFIAAIISPASFSQEPSSQCIQCHTNLKKLIRLCWEVEKLKPRKGQSSETTGEG